jgi:hypothetical protein
MKHMKKRTKTHKRTKRLFSVLLVLCIIASVIPNAAFAAGCDATAASKAATLPYTVKYVDYYKENGAITNTVLNEVKSAYSVLMSADIVNLTKKDGYIAMLTTSRGLSYEYQTYENDLVTTSYLDKSRIAPSSDTYDIYLDPVGGDDGNDGSSATAAVKSLDTAKSLVKAYYDSVDNKYHFRNIKLMNTLDITSSQDLTFFGLGRTQLTRYEGTGNNDEFTGVMLKITGDSEYTAKGEDSYTLNADTGAPEPVDAQINYSTKVELYDIIIDGGLEINGETKYTSPAVVVDGAELTLSYGAIVKNNNIKLTSAYPLYTGSGINLMSGTVVQGGLFEPKPSRLVMNGGSVTGNTCIEYSSDVAGAGGISVAGFRNDAMPFYVISDTSERQYSTGSSFIMNDGIISHNEGGAAALSAGTGGYYEINNGFICNNKSNSSGLNGLTNYSGYPNGTIIDSQYKGSTGGTNSLLTAVHINNAVISENKANSIISAMALYINGATIQYNERTTDVSLSGTDAPSAIKTFYLSVPAEEDNDTPFVVKGNVNFFNTIEVQGTCKIYKGDITDNIVLDDMSGASNYAGSGEASGVYVNTNTGDRIGGAPPYAANATVKVEIKNVNFTNNQTTFASNVSAAPLGCGAVYIYEMGGGGSNSTGKTAKRVFENCTFKENSTQKNVNQNSVDVDNVSGGAIGFTMQNYSTIDDERTVSVKNCTFDSNYTVGTGGAIGKVTTYSQGAILNIEDCEFTNNASATTSSTGVFPFGGGAIGYRGGDSQTMANYFNIKNSTFKSNSSAQSGGAISTSAAITNIENCEFANNTSNWNDNRTYEKYKIAGGALFSQFDYGFTIKNSKIYGNKAPNGGALGFDNQRKEIDIENCEIYNNSTATAKDYSSFKGYKNNGNLNSYTTADNAIGTGGAIYIHTPLSTPSLSIKNTNINNNSASISGGGIQIFDSGTLDTTIENSNINNNSAALMGGGMFLVGSRAILNNTSVSENSASAGAGIFYNNTQNSNILALHESKINDNYVSEDAGADDIINNGQNIGRMGGGIFVRAGGTIELGYDGEKPSEICGNSADNGGGVAVHYSYVGNFSINNGKISENKALNTKGGGIYSFNGGYQINLNANGEISGNTAWNGNGGGVYLGSQAILNIQGGKITDNGVGKYGAGAYVDDGGTLNLNSGTIKGNTSDLSTSTNYSGTVLYKTASGTVNISPSGDLSMFGDVRTIQYDAPILMTAAMPTSALTTYISVPEKDRYESTIVSEVLANGDDYVVVNGSGYTITDDDFKKFEYIGNEDYKLVLDEENNCIKIAEDEAPKRSITVTHTWDDENNQDGLRPLGNESVKAQLMALDNETAQAKPVLDDDEQPMVLTLSDSNDYTDTWTDLPKYDSSRNVIQYSIKMTYAASDSDDYIPEGYVRTISTLTDGYLFNLKSIHTPEKITITANKIWNDDLKSYETRTQTPNDINIALTADDTEITPTSIDSTSNARRWVYVWKDLPVYNNGEVIDYSVDEGTVPTGYTKTVESNISDDGNITYTITNTADGWEKTIVDDVELTLNYPTSTDRTLLSIAPTITENDKYQIESYKWLRRGSAVAATTKFENDVEYGLQVTLVPANEDTEFAPDVKTTVNIADNAPATKSASISTDIDSITLEWTFKGKPSAADTMSLFAVDGDALRKVDCTINPPSQDRLPSYSAPTANGEHYEVGTVKWYNNNTATELGETDRFTIGVPYSVQAKLNSDTGYSFDFGETNINVNGNVRTNKAILQANSTTSDIVWYFDALTEETHKVTVEAEHGTASATPNEKVTAGTEVAISDLEPAEGYTTAGAEITVTRTGEETPITVKDNKFTMPGSDVTVKVVFNKIPAQIGDVTVESKSVEYGYTDGNVLTAEVDKNNTDYTYTYQWYSTPYNATINGTPIAEANESTYTVPTGKNSGEYYYYCIATATRKDNGETASNAGGAVFTVTPKKIGNVSATIIDPVPEQKTSSNTGAILPIGEKYVQSSSIVWKKNGEPLGTDDEFEFGTTYTAELTLEPISENYSFTNPVSGKVNDDEAKNVEPVSGTVTLTYTVTTPEEPEPGVPYAVIANPEIVTYEYDSASLTAVVKNCDFDKYTYTYQWYVKNSNSDEADEMLENESGDVIANDQELTLALPTDKEVGVEKYYVLLAGEAKSEDDKDVNGTSNNGAFVVQPKEITEITITGIDAPKYGETPDSDATIADTENYIQSGVVAWYNGENQISAFDYNTKYAAKINLAPKANYVFADTVTATVNGEEATVEIKENGNEAIVTYNGFSNTEAASEVSPSPSTEATVEPTTEATSTPEVTETTAPTSSPEVTETTAPTSSPEVTETTEPTSSPEVTTSPSPSPTATTKVSRGGGSGSVKTKATATPTVEPTTEPTTEPTSIPTDGNGSGNNGGNGGSGNGGHSTPELNKQDHFAYMAGYPDNLFMPDNSISRAEVTVMFSRLLTQKMDSDSDYTVSFPDIDADAWYKSQVGFMEQYGIVEGYEDGTFRPENPITRAEFAVIASKFDKLSDTEENAFSDVDDDYWATPYILLAHSNGWINGYEDGTFRPLNSITRAEVVSIVNRMLERSCDSEFVTENAENIVNYSDISDQHWAYLDILEASNAHLYEKNPDEVWTELIDKE